MDFRECHLKVFESSTAGTWPAARIPDRWFKSIGYETKSRLSRSIVGRRLNREDLRHISGDNGVDTLDVCMLIFAWGGMSVNNGKGVLQELAWVDTAHRLRIGNIDHIQAYQLFFDHYTLGQIKHCGPAYYTKLLFFLPSSDEHRGIIMDQWTARSINLLANEPIVTLLKNYRPVGSYRVSPLNDCRVYKRFFTIARVLAARLEITLEEAELRLFSEGRGKGLWRDYVKQHDPA